MLSSKVFVAASYRYSCVVGFYIVYKLSEIRVVHIRKSNGNPVVFVDKCQPYGMARGESSLEIKNGHSTLLCVTLHRCYVSLLSVTIVAYHLKHII